MPNPTLPICPNDGTTELGRGVGGPELYEGNAGVGGTPCICAIPGLLGGSELGAPSGKGGKGGLIAAGLTGDPLLENLSPGGCNLAGLPDL